MSRINSILRKSIDFLFGYDFFISYCWADGRKYAVELNKKLRAIGYSCFLDSSDFAKGDNWKNQGRRALRKTSRLLLVGSPYALQSDPVINEIRIFTEFGRRVLPINIGNTLSQLDATGGIGSYLEAEILTIDESIATLQSGPSEHAVSAVINSFTLVRQEHKRLRWFIGATFLFLLIGIVAIYFGFLAESERQKTVKQMEIATSRGLAGQATNRVKGDYSLSLLLAAHATNISNAAVARDALLKVVPAQPFLKNFMYGDEGGISSIFFSPNSKVLATAYQSGGIQLWDTATSTATGDIFGNDTYSSLAFSPNGETIAASGDDSASITIWNVKGQKLKNEYSCEEDEKISKIIFSPSGLYLNSIGTNVLSRNLKSGECKLVNTIQKTDSVSITNTQFSSDGEVVLLGRSNGTVELLDAETGLNHGGLLTGHNGYIKAMSLSRDGKVLAVGDLGGNVWLWDIESRSLLHGPLSGHRHDITSFAFISNGEVLASSGVDGVIRIWQVRTGKLLQELFTGDSGYISGISLSTDGLLASASEDGTIRLWKLAPWVDFRVVLENNTNNWDTEKNVDPSDREAIKAFIDKLDQSEPQLLWGYIPAPLQKKYVIRWRTPQSPAPKKIDLSPNGQVIVGLEDSGVIKLWDVNSGEPFEEVLLNQNNEGQAINSGPIGLSSVIFSPDGQSLLQFTYDQNIQLLDLRSKKVITEFIGHQSSIKFAVFSPDGETLVSASDDNSLFIWDVKSGSKTNSLKLDSGIDVVSLAYSPHGEELALGTRPGAISVWSSKTGEFLRMVVIEAGYEVAWSPDGLSLAVWGGNNSVVILDPEDLETKGRTLTGHSDAILTAKFSPDSSTLATASFDGTIRLWDVNTGLQLGFSLTSAGFSYGIAPYTSQLFFVDDGEILVSNGFSEVVLWDVGMSNLQKQACAIANRELTLEEWREFVGDTLPFQQVCN